MCEQAKDSGPCYAYENRFYFDKEQDKCLPFTYGGCQGNNNNFESMEACETRCPSKTQPTAAPVSTSTAALTSTPQSSGKFRCLTTWSCTDSSRQDLWERTLVAAELLAEQTQDTSRYTQNLQGFNQGCEYYRTVEICIFTLKYQLVRFV